MPRVVCLRSINERGGGGAAGVPDTPIAPRILTYGSPNVHDGAAAAAVPPTNGAGTDDVVSVVAYPFVSMFY